MNYIKAISFCIVLMLVGHVVKAQPVPGKSECNGGANVSSQASIACPGDPAGGDITFFSGNPNTSYRWYSRDGNSGPFLADGPTFSGVSFPDVAHRSSVGGLVAGRQYIVKTAGGTCDLAGWQTSTVVTVGTTTPNPISISGDSPLRCSDSPPMSITASGGASGSYTWSLGSQYNTLSSISFTPTANMTVTVTATSSNCPNSFVSKSLAITVGHPAGTATITVGEGEICSGTQASYHAESTNATSFQWSVEPSNAGTPQDLMTDTNTITWNQNFSGAAKVHVTAFSQTGCTATPTDDFDVQVDHTPVTPTVASTQSVLYNTSTTLTASGLQVGETYQWFQQGPSGLIPLQGNIVGPLKDATSFTYYVGGYNPAGGCSTDVSHRAVTVVSLYLNAPPIPDLSGCVDITANFHAAPAETTYYVVSSATGEETGAPINQTYTFPTTAGTSTAYYVRTKANTVNLWGPPVSLNLTQQLPSSYNLTGVNFCDGRLGGSVTLNSSQSGTTYQLYKESVPWGDALAGSGSSLTWNELSAGGRYSVLATKTGPDPCTAKMNGDITVLKIEPAVFNVLGGGVACDAGTTIRTDGSEPGVKYQLKRDGVNVGDPIDGHTDRSFVAWTNVSVAGAYTVTAFNATTTSCTQEMNGSARVMNGPTVTILADQYPCTYHFAPWITKNDDNCGLKTFSWDFGDGTTSTEAQLFHTYASDGTYYVTLDVTSVCDGTTSCSAHAVMAVTVGSYNFTDTPVEASSYLLDKVINTSASTFSDSWTLATEQQTTNNVNPFLSGERGVWRNEGQYAYKETRNQSTPVNIATDGTFSMYTFNWEQASLAAIPNWIKANTVTRYSPYGSELENKDVMNIYSSAVYDYSGQLISAQGANMRQDEMAFTGFETNVNSGNTGNWTFGSQAPQTFEVYRVISGRGHMAIVEAPDITRFDVGKVDVVAVHLRTSPILFIGSSNSIHDDVIVCKTPYPNAQSPEAGKVMLVLKEAPFDGAWLGTVAIRVNASGVTATTTNAVAHTGASSLEITGTNSFPQPQLVLDKGKSYFISTWVSIGNLNVTEPLDSDVGIDVVLTDANSSATVTKQLFVGGPVIEGWQQVTGVFSSDYDKTKVEIKFRRGGLAGNQSLYVDDLRFHPNNGVMKSYVYDLKDYRLSAILDEQNFASLFYYDDEGNLTVTKKETDRGIKTISENVTHIKQQ